MLIQRDHPQDGSIQKLKSYIPRLLVVARVEAIRYPLDWLRFGRGASYHALSAKLFGFGLLVSVFAIVGSGTAWPVFDITLMLGVLFELKGIAISLVLPAWTHLDLQPCGPRCETSGEGLSNSARDQDLIRQYRMLPELVRLILTAPIGALTWPCDL